MKPEDVPGELVKPLAEMLLHDYDQEFNAQHLSWKNFAGQARKILAVVLPSHEALVRAEIVEQMQPVYSEAHKKVTAYGTTYPVDAVGKCIEIARGTQ